MPLDKNKTRRFQVLDRCFADQHKKYFRGGLTDCLSQSIGGGRDASS